MNKVRVDKWLWAVRIFKSRTLAGNTVRQGKVRVNDAPVKPSTGVEVGDRITVQKNGFNLQFEVTKLIEKRVGAPIAVTCYVDHTPADELSKYKDWFVGKAGTEFREKGTGRPTKKNRRQINRFKDEDLDEYWGD